MMTSDQCQTRCFTTDLYRKAINLNQLSSPLRIDPRAGPNNHLPGRAEHSMDVRWKVVSGGSISFHLHFISIPFRGHSLARCDAAQHLFISERKERSPVSDKQIIAHLNNVSHFFLLFVRALSISLSLYARSYSVSINPGGHRDVISGS